MTVVPKLSIHVVYKPDAPMTGANHATATLQRVLIDLVCETVRKDSLLSPEIVSVTWHEAKYGDVMPLRKPVSVEVTLTKLVDLPEIAVFVDKLLSRLKEALPSFKNKVSVSVTYVDAVVAC